MGRERDEELGYDLHCSHGKVDAAASGKVIGWNELVDEPLLLARLLDDVLLVILPQRATQLVVIHLRAIFALTPQTRQLVRTFDLENS